MSSNGLRVALVGANYQENLALEYLASALDAAGHTPRLVAFGSRTDQARTLAEIQDFRADVVGISIAFQALLSDSLDLAVQLRCRGYQGHITCGGHVPSFEFDALLLTCSAMDSVVRHDGELTLVELADRLANGQPLDGTKGLVWRDGTTLRVEAQRPVVTDLDLLTPPLRRSPPRSFAGIRTAYAIASRGCSADCAYCCVRALSRDAGGPSIRLRRPEDLANELARIFRSGRAKVVFLQDDLFILPSENAAAKRLRNIAAALDAENIPDRIFWAKARPNTISSTVVDAARQLGIIHLFLGIENHCENRLRYLGRNHGPKDNERALTLLSENGIGASFNVMLFDPDCTLEEVATNLDFLAAHLDLAWNICRTELYSGTSLLKRVGSEGRLLGDYRSYGYVMRDLHAELMFRILRVAFRSHSFEATSVMNQVISLCFAEQLQRRILADPTSHELAQEIRELTISVHRDTIATLRSVLDFAATASLDDFASARRYAIEVGVQLNQHDLKWIEQCDRLTRLLDARGRAVVC